MRVLFAAGGTGGHVNPALSAAQAVKRRCGDAAEILFVGTADKIEATLAPKAGFQFRSIDITGFQRSFAPADVLWNLGTLRRLLFVTGQCKTILREFRPDVAVGFGGYVSGPVLRTAHKLGIKTAIHEQNAFPGKTNIALSKYADAVMLTTMEAAPRMRCAVEPVRTGLPVRAEMLEWEKDDAKAALGIPPDMPVVLSTGGSLGAESLNRAMCEVFPHFRDRNVCFIHGYGQMGRFVPELLREKGYLSLETPKLRVTEYIYNMAQCMAAADLVISRAGASSIAEMQAMGKASVLIPYPYAAENHQYFNAKTLEDRQAAFLIEQKDLTPDKLVALIEKLLAQPAVFARIGQNARNMAVLGAEEKICDIILGLCG